MQSNRRILFTLLVIYLFVAAYLTFPVFSACMHRGDWVRWNESLNSCGYPFGAINPYTISGGSREAYSVGYSVNMQVLVVDGLAWLIPPLLIGLIIFHRKQRNNEFRS